MEYPNQKTRYKAGDPLPVSSEKPQAALGPAVSVPEKTPAPKAEKAPKEPLAGGEEKPKNATGTDKKDSRDSTQKQIEKTVTLTLTPAGKPGGKAGKTPKTLTFERPDKAAVINLMVNTKALHRENGGGNVPPGPDAAKPAEEAKTAGATQNAKTGKRKKRHRAWLNGEELEHRKLTREELAAYREKHKRKKQKQGRTWRAVSRTLGVAGLVLGMALVLVFGAITMVCVGPFPTAKELFVVSVNETSAVKFLSRIYFTEEEVGDILAKNAILVPDEVTDTTQSFTENEADKDSIEIIDVYGSTYKGKMMIVHDPSRIQLATLPTYGADVRGRQVEQFVAEAGAVAGINAGGFVDDGGVGKGGQPLGLVIHEGELLSGTADTECNLIGFDGDDHLVVGMMTGRQAMDMGVRDAVHFEPTLIVNGKPAEVSGTGGGLNPRTVIGQREDGAVLLLVIDGRQPHSVGATLQDCMQEMMNFGAVNAANLDGGSSSMMVYEGEVINVCASLNGSRSQPAAWLVV